MSMLFHSRFIPLWLAIFAALLFGAGLVAVSFTLWLAIPFAVAAVLVAERIHNAIERVSAIASLQAGRVYDEERKRELREVASGLDGALAMFIEDIGHPGHERAEALRSADVGSRRGVGRVRHVCGCDFRGHASPPYFWSMMFSENRCPLFGIML